MTQLADLVRVWQRAAAAAGRLTKIRELAGYLRAVPAEPIETAAQYLSGRIAAPSQSGSSPSSARTTASSGT